MNTLLASTIDWPEAAVLIALFALVAIFALVAFGLYLMNK